MITQTQTMPFNPLEFLCAFQKPRHLTEVSSWHKHIPFAFALVETLKPGLIVELGTYKGDSYCSFCEAVDTLRLPTTCYAVDTWEGDEQSGNYDNSIWEELKAYHDPLYGSFSTL